MPSGSPGGGAIAEPAFYAYADPEPGGYRDRRVRPEGAFYSGELGEFVLPYEVVRRASSPDEALLAFCESTNQVRSFRLDRVLGVVELDDAYEIPATFSVDEHLHDRKVLRVGQLPRMRVRYSPRVARWIAEREGVEVEADGSLTLDHPLADVQWGVRHVLQYGPDAEVLEPPEVREEIVARLSSVTRVENG